MFLAIDIGNTNIKIALFKERKTYSIWRLKTVKDHPLKRYRKIFRKMFSSPKIQPADIDEILICSVAPSLTKVFKKLLFSVLSKRPLVLGRDLRAPIKNLYKNPGQVGQDRLANALAAFNKYGGPTIVVDFGTALTFDLISTKGSYLGGIIVPGIEISLNALVRNAELLPKIRLEKPRTFLGKDTVSSMKSGIVYGYSFLVEGILERLKKRFKKRPRIIATGGAAELLFRYCKSFHKIDDNLTLDGLRIIYQMRRKKAKNIENK